MAPLSSGLLFGLRPPKLMTPPEIASPGQRPRKRAFFFDVSDHFRDVRKMVGRLGWASLQQRDMRVVKNLAIGGQERDSQHSRCRHDQLIGGVSMETRRQLTGFDGDLCGEGQYLYCWIRCRELQPFSNRPVQFELADLNLLGDFPEGDDADPDSIRDGILDQFALTTLQLGGISSPPVPDVCIEYDHWQASHS